MGGGEVAAFLNVQAPTPALADPIRFMAYARSYATPEDMKVTTTIFARRSIVRLPESLIPDPGSIGTPSSDGFPRHRCRSAGSACVSASIAPSFRPCWPAGARRRNASAIFGEIVRLEGQPSPLRNPHQYERIASAVGIAPKLHHVDEVNRVAVMDFVEGRPLSTFPGGPRALSRAVGTNP